MDAGIVSRRRIVSRRALSIPALLMGFLAALPIEALSITRGPYLGRADDVSMSVVWLTDTGSTSSVEYATDEDSWSTVSDPNVSTRHVVRISPLIAGAQYRCRVVLDGQP